MAEPISEGNIAVGPIIRPSCKTIRNNNTSLMSRVEPDLCSTFNRLLNSFFSFCQAGDTGEMASSTPYMWNKLGLGVAAAYASLGTASFLNPTFVSQQLGFRSLIGNAQDDATGLLAFIGARDLSFSIAIIALSRAGRYREMGIVISSTMLFCVVDLFIMGRNGKWAE